MSGGRPTSLTPEVQRKLVVLVTAGHTLNAAAVMCHLGARTVREWFYLGRKGSAVASDVYRRFRQAIKKAQSMHERRLLGRIDTASRDPKHWTAAAWILERRYPEKYALRLTRMLEKEREAMLAELRKTMQPETFAEVARALVAAQQNARGRGREHGATAH